MIDSHCHLNLEHFEDDRDITVARAVSDGVTAFMNIGYDRTSMRQTLELLEQYPFMYGAVGVHPHDAAAYNPELDAEVRAALEHPRVVAVGEIGLDFYRDIAPREVQDEVFRKMIALSREKHKPIVIHCRDAFNEVIETLLSEGGTYHGIFHAFSAGEAEARSIFQLGFHVGIGGVVTYKNARLAETVAVLPIEKIVIETDSPYLTPHPWRGKRNEPAFVAHVLRTIARVKNMTVAEVDRITTENYRAAMGLPAEALPGPVYKIGEAVYIQSAAATASDLDRVAPESVVEEAILTGVVDPLENMENTLAIASRAHELGWRVRVNTSGFANHAAGRDLTKELAGIVDELDITFFGVTPKQHDELAYPEAGNEGWEMMKDFVRCSVASGIETVCEFVAVPGFEPEPCREFARQLGARYDIRMYRS